MSDYDMPALSQQERQELISFAKIISNDWANVELHSKLIQIALAALTAEPVDPADCFHPVYLAPPVPTREVKEEH